LFVVGALALISFVQAQPSSAPREDFWVPDGIVNAVVETNGVLYIGGDFNSIAPNGGRGALFNIFSGDATPLFPQANGAILSIIPDGAGGWFVGGLFTQVGGVARTNLAHILSNLTVDTNWAPNPYGFVAATQRNGVYALLRASNALYVAGIFTNIAGVPRNNLAALDVTTGRALSWSADVAGEVYCLASRSNALYLGGRFTAVRGVARSQIAAVDTATAGVLGWDPNAGGTSIDPTVNALVPGNDVLYVGGYFSRIGGAARNGLAALDFVTGLATAWNPNLSDVNIGYGVQAIALTCDTVYFGGVFTNVGSAARNNIAAVDATTGVATPWDPNPDLEVAALVIFGNTIYAGGRFTTIGGGAHDSVAALDIPTGQATVWSPRSDRGVIAMALTGNSIYLGGALSAGGLSRRNLAALDTATGQPLAWNPGADGIVRALAVRRNTVYVGGEFSSVNGQSRRCLAAINSTNGQTLGWRADAADPLGLVTPPNYLVVYALAVGSDSLYVGGVFTGLGGSTRVCAGALDLTNATVKSWVPTIYGAVHALAVASNSVFVGGSFHNIDFPQFLGTHYPRDNIAEVNATTGEPTSWNPSASDSVLALTLGANTVYAGGFFTTIGGSNRNYAAAISRASATATAWNPKLDGGYPAVYSIVLSSNVAFLGGGFATASGQPRAGLVAVDAATGATNAFDAQLGDLRATVVAMAVKGSRLFCGGLFLTIGDQVRPFLAEFVEDGFPRITTQPAAQTLSPGQTIHLQAAATGLANLRYQWQFNGTNIARATNTSLSISNAQVSHSGSYRVIVTNSLGQARSLEARVTVLLPAAITVQPVGRTNAPGSNIVLRVTATGNPPPTYQWRLNGVNIPGAIYSTFTITNAQPTNGGSYSVVVANIGAAINSAVAKVLVTSPALPFADNLANRGVITGGSGLGSGNNVGLSKEPGETNHVGKLGGRSAWVSWFAPSNGIATFSTRGSSFDTLLAIYTGTSVAALTPIAADEDGGGFLTSQAAFNAVAGTEYSIVVDGFAGQSGSMVLSWNLDTSTVPFPRILTQPLSQSVFTGQAAAFSVAVNTPTPEKYQWFFGCRALDGETNASLTITNVHEANVGNYHVVVMNASSRVATSFDASLEIGPQPKVVSQDKLEDLYLPPGGSGFAAGAKSKSALATSGTGFVPVSVGPLNSQILDNSGATTSPGETNHCGVIGGASKWFGLTPTADATFVIDTIGSSIDTVLAVYTNDASNLLIPPRFVTCDNDGAPDRIRSLVRFAARGGQDYLVAVDGVNGAQGVINLNWRLGHGPSITQAPTRSTNRLGQSATLVANTSPGDALPTYFWFLNGAPLPGFTTASISLLIVTPDMAGSYTVVVSNLFGSVTSTVATVTVEVPLLTEYAVIEVSGQRYFRLRGQYGPPVVVQRTIDFRAWTPVFTNQMTNAFFEFKDLVPSTVPSRFYRAVRWP
jgi:hypothetical protein